MYKIPRCKTKSFIPQPCLKLAKREMLMKKTDFFCNQPSKIIENKSKFLNPNRYFGHDISNQVKNCPSNYLAGRQVCKSLSNISERVRILFLFQSLIIFFQFHQYAKNIPTNNIIQRTNKILGSSKENSLEKKYLGVYQDSLLNGQKFSGNKGNIYYGDNTSTTANNYSSSLRASLRSKLHNSVSFGASTKAASTISNNSGSIKISEQKDEKQNDFMFFSSKELM